MESNQLGVVEPHNMVVVGDGEQAAGRARRTQVRDPRTQIRDSGLWEKVAEGVGW